jgi:signal transduction histidine kinase
MLNSLRSRLVLLYVVAAAFLIAIVGGTVTAFAFSSFGYISMQAVSNVARVAPDVAAEEMHGRTLEAAAPDIVRRLAQPGLRVIVLKAERGFDRPLAVSRIDNPEGVPPMGPPPQQMPGDGSGAPPPRLGPPGNFDYSGGPPRTGGRWEFPIRLNAILGLHPARVNIPGGHVVIFPDGAPLQSSMTNLWKWLLPAGLLAIVGAFLLGRYITDQALRPLVETTESLQRFAHGDFTPRPVVAERSDEIGALAAAYNDAAKQVAAAFDERRKAETRMRQFIADAGHELRTPLTVMTGFIDVLRSRSTGADERTTEGFEIMRAESRRMRALIDKLIRLARLDAPDPGDTGSQADFNLAQTVKRACAAMRALDGGDRISVHCDDEVWVHADEGEVYDAVANLLDNALKYAPGSPVEAHCSADGGSALVEVADRGPGLNAHEQARVFERFYRGDDRGEREGFGLGLAIVKRTAQRAGGDVGVASEPGAGARFWIRLPLTAGRPVQAAAPG